MPFARNTSRRAREGRGPSWPSTASIASFSTGAFGRQTEVRVMYATPGSEPARLPASRFAMSLSSRRQLEVGSRGIEAPREQRTQQPLREQAGRQGDEDHRHEIDHEQREQRRAGRRARPAAEPDEARPHGESAGAGALAEDQP